MRKFLVASALIGAMAFAAPAYAGGKGHGGHGGHGGGIKVNAGLGAKLGISVKSLTKVKLKVGLGLGLGIGL